MVFSPVKEFGALKTEIRTSSITISLSLISPKRMVCDFTSVNVFFRLATKILSVIIKASGPEIRITAIAPIPGEVDMAQIESIFNNYFVF